MKPNVSMTKYYRDLYHLNDKGQTSNGEMIKDRQAMEK